MFEPITAPVGATGPGSLEVSVPFIPVTVGATLT